MAYDRKTWKFRDDITEDELNRMEDGIEEGITKAEQAEQTAQQAAQTATQTANELAAHLADITSQEVGKGADMIGLPDPNNLFSATTVRGALEELFTSVSDGKNLIAAAITDMGGIASGSDTFEQLADAIRAITTGKKWASGTVVSSTSTETYTLINGSTSSAYTVVVTGLNFKPSFIYLFHYNDVSVVYTTVYSEFQNDMYPKTVKSANYTNSSTASTNYHFKGDVPPASVTSSGFTLPVRASGATFTWIAFE